MNTARSLAPKEFVTKDGVYTMIHFRWSFWRRDLLVGLLASFVTASALLPFAWSAMRDRQEQVTMARQLAQAASLPAEPRAADANRQRALAQKNLIDQAADFAGFGDKPDAEVMHVTTGAVAPESPEGAHVLIDKKAATFSRGDIVVYRVDDENYLGRLVGVDSTASPLTIGRNGEVNRQVAVGNMVGLLIPDAKRCCRNRKE